MNMLIVTEGLATVANSSQVTDVCMSISLEFFISLFIDTDVWGDRSCDLNTKHNQFHS